MKTCATTLAKLRKIALPAAASSLVPGQALAYHETLGVGGGAPVHVLIVLAIAVVVALVLLSRWQPKKRGRKKASIAAPKAGRKSRR
jgi:hypothetical protein